MKTYNISIKILKSIPVFGTQLALMIQVPAPLSIPITSSYVSSIYVGVVVDSGGVDVAWLKYDEGTKTVFQIDPTTQVPVTISTNSKAAVYDFKLKLFDPCSNSNYTATNFFRVDLKINQVPQIIPGTSSSFTIIQG